MNEKINELVPAGGKALKDFSIEKLNLPGVMEIRDGILNLEDLPEKAVIILALRAFGLSCRHIGSMVGLSSGNVSEYLERYDPSGLCRISNEDKRRITSQMLMTGAVGALMEITHEKLAASDASELAGIASKCVMTAEKIRELDKVESGRISRLDAALSYMDAEIVEEK
jgi:hypothetical protein